METSRLSWFNPFGYRSTQNAILDPNSLVNPRLTEGQNWSIPHQKIIFQVFTSNLRLLEIFDNFDPRFTLRNNQKI